LLEVVVGDGIDVPGLRVVDGIEFESAIEVFGGLWPVAGLGGEHAEFDIGNDEFGVGLDGFEERGASRFGGVLFDAEFAETRPGVSVLGVDGDGFFEVLGGVGGLVFEERLEAVLVGFFRVLGGHHRGDADGGTFDTGDAVEEDGADVGTVGIAAVEQVDVVGSVAGERGAEFAVHHAIAEGVGGEGVATAGGLGAAKPSGVAAGGGSDTGIGGIGDDGVAVAPLEVEVSVGVGVGDGAGEPTADALDGDVRRYGGAVGHEDFAGDVDGTVGVEGASASGRVGGVGLDAGLSSVSGGGGGLGLECREKE